MFVLKGQTVNPMFYLGVIKPMLYDNAPAH